jgi:hypothetical protein
MVVPDSMSATITGIVDALAPKEGGEDPMNVVVRQLVMTGSHSTFTMLMMHASSATLRRSQART